MDREILWKHQHFNQHETNIQWPFKFWIPLYIHWRNKMPGPKMAKMKQVWEDQSKIQQQVEFCFVDLHQLDKVFVNSTPQVLSNFCWVKVDHQTCRLNDTHSPGDCWNYMVQFAGCCRWTGGRGKLESLEGTREDLTKCFWFYVCFSRKTLYNQKVEHKIHITCSEDAD